MSRMLVCCRLFPLLMLSAADALTFDLSLTTRFRPIASSPRHLDRFSHDSAKSYSNTQSSRWSKDYFHSGQLHASSFSEMEQNLSKTDNSDSNPENWLSLGMSSIYLAHFASIYTQLPGLYGSTGLLPLTENHIVEIENACWALQLVPDIQLGMEVFAALGILVSAAQIAIGCRRGFGGVLTFGLQWVLWHDLVFAGGRFTSYQMDYLLLDAAPIAVLAATKWVPSAVTFGYRWLLTRLYLGAGAVKLLSCDASWRDLSAVHWHFQSQPLPNVLGKFAYQHILNHPVGEAMTLFVLMLELSAPFLFLAPSQEVRLVAFLLNTLLMVGICLFGNFGPLQALLIVIGIALLDPQYNKDETRLIAPELEVKEERANEQTEVSTNSSYPWIELVVTGTALALAAGGVFWVIHHIMDASCNTSFWGISSLVYDAIILAILSLLYNLIGVKNSVTIVTNVVVGLALVLGSSVPLAQGLGVPIPFSKYLDVLNVGALPYGLFAIMTGVNGVRPALAIEAAHSMEGPWVYVPLLYQVNDPNNAFLPLCFPHFPRLDW